MPEDEFAEHKEALVRAKQQQDGQLYAESDRHWDHIVNRRYNFRSREQEVAAVGALTKGAMMVRHFVGVVTSRDCVQCVSTAVVVFDQRVDCNRNTQ